MLHPLGEKSMNRSMIAALIFLLVAPSAFASGGSGIGKGSPNAVAQPPDHGSRHHAKGHQTDSGAKGSKSHHKHGATPSGAAP
jgi:hypothetical protein